MLAADNVIVLDGDSDEGDHLTKVTASAIKDAEGHNRPAKRQRQEASSFRDTINTVDLCELSHVSDTVQEPSVTEAPVQPAAASAAADDAESPTLSPQQVCKPGLAVSWNHPCTLTCALRLLLQQEVEDLVKQGKNVFFTGNAGTGDAACITDFVC